MLMKGALGAFFALAFAWTAQAQNNFPTPGGATVPGYVTMCISGNIAVPCNPGGGGGGLAAGAAVTGCPAQSNLFVTSALQLGCVAAVTESDTGAIQNTGLLQVPAGGLATPSINWGTSTGFYGVSGNSVNVAVNGMLYGFWGGAGYTQNIGNIGLTAVGGVISIGGQSFLTTFAAGTWQLGNLDRDTNATMVAQTLKAQGAIGGGTTNQAGKDFTIAASPSKGNVAGGRVLVTGTLVGASGSVVNPQFPMLTLTPATATTTTLQLGDGTNITTYDSCTGFTTSATGVIACTTSAMRFKDMFPAQALNLIGLDALRTDIPWKYRTDAEYGLDPSRVHVGLFADDVEKLDARCVTHRDGKVADYEDRCIIAYLVADRKAMKAEIEALKARLP